MIASAPAAAGTRPNVVFLLTDVVTLPEVSKSAGYATGIFGKWHLGDEPEYQPDRCGFDEVFIHGGRRRDRADVSGVLRRCYGKHLL